MLIAIIILVIISLLLILGRKEVLSKEIQVSSFLWPFYKTASLIFHLLIKPDKSSYYRKIYENNAILYSPAKAKDETDNGFINKFALMLISAFAGSILFLLMGLSTKDTSILKDGHMLERQAPEKKDYLVKLDARIDGVIYKDIEIKVSPEKYTEKEFLESMNSFCKDLEAAVLNGQSQDHIDKDISLPDALDDYPYSIEWSNNNPHVINSQGLLWPDKNIYADPAGTIVILTATITYEDYKYLYEFGINVFPKEKPFSDQLKDNLQLQIANNDKESSSDKYLSLPDNIDGATIIWSESKKSNTLIFIALIIFICLVIFFGKDKDISKKLELRNKELLDDYPEIVGKLTLLIGAGMSIRNAWKKISNDYISQKNASVNTRYAYEEMLITAHEMESGVEEAVCFSHFSNRVKLQKYVKLISLLEQNVRMGTRGLIDDLTNESKDAFTEKKNNAEKKGEEAGTKLLLPMFMMLIIVMVVIMIPAFMSM